METARRSALESLLARDRWIVLGALAGLTLLAWLYLIHLHYRMTVHMEMPMLLPWRPADFLYTFLMWAVMMAGMMLPSAAPVILLFAQLNRRRQQRDAPYVPAGLFAAGYLLVWSAFSGAATLAQWRLHAAAVLEPHSQTVAPWAGGALLVAAGIFQATPLKNACLRHCRSPLAFFATRWREGAAGAVRMGAEHGAWCVGCCWLLMGLLFVAGVMNLLWVAAIAGLVLVEKALPRGRVAGLAAGVLLAAAGLAQLLRAMS